MVTKPWNIEDRGLGQSKLWWRRWRSGSYDQTTIVRMLLQHRLELESEIDNYFILDLDELRKTGAIHSPCRSTRDMVAWVIQALRIWRRDRVDSIYKNLGMTR